MNGTASLRVGLSPCPNDTFVIGAIATGRVSPPRLKWDIELHDIDHLNRAAAKGRFDVVKVSCAAYPRLREAYQILDTGAALADGFGPLVVARKAFPPGDLARARVLAPGRQTTAALLYRLWMPAARPPAHARYDRIVPQLLSGRFDAGIIIHESRPGCRETELDCLIDLGAWWKQKTGLPLALGCYLIRRELYAELARPVENALRASMRLARAGDADVDAYVRAHAQARDAAVIAQHIARYVNHYTWRLGRGGRAAIEALAAQAAQPAVFA